MSRKPKAAAVADDLEPVPEVVATLARLLVDARAGNIKAVALAYVLSSRPHIGSASGIAVDDPLNAHLLTAAVRNLEHEWLHAVRGK